MQYLFEMFISVALYVLHSHLSKQINLTFITLHYCKMEVIAPEKFCMIGCKLLIPKTFNLWHHGN